MATFAVVNFVLLVIFYKDTGNKFDKSTYLNRVEAWIPLSLLQQTNTTKMENNGFPCFHFSFLAIHSYWPSKAVL